MGAVSAAVQELHASNSVMYDRFKNIVVGDKHIQCNDQSNTVHTEVTNLKQRFFSLEENRDIHNETISVMKDEIKKMKERVEHLNETLSLDKAEIVPKPKPVIRDQKVDKPKGADASSIPLPTVKDSSRGKVHVSSSSAGTSSSTGASESAGRRVTENSNALQTNRRKAKQTNQTDDHRTESSDVLNNGEIMTSRSPEVVRQMINCTPNGDQYWRVVSSLAMDKGKQLFRDLQGVHTVICLDISESMTRGNAWNEALGFLRDYLSGLEEMASTRGLSDEYVALVTFGHETKTQHHFTNRFNDIRRVVNTLRLGGPSPLLGGVLLSIAAAGSSEHQLHRTATGVHVISKVVIVSDGLLTENELLEGPDISESSKLDETKSTVVSALIEFNIDIFCVPVGNSSNMEFFELIVDTSSGRLLDHKSGIRLSRSYYLHMQLLDPFGHFGTEIATTGDSSDLSVQDMEDLKFIQKRNQTLLTGSLEKRGDKYRESSSQTLPVIGSRVRRGPDWKWQDQDSYGPGTVVGHAPDDRGVWVTWDDNDMTNIYQYNVGNYDVLTVDEPRQLALGQKMAVGCSVRSGKDWKDAHKSYNKGVVIQTSGSNTAEVRWENGDRGTYSFCGIGGQEIEVCPTGFEPFNTDGRVLGYATSMPTSDPEVPSSNVPRKKNKNKNI